MKRMLTAILSVGIAGFTFGQSNQADKLLGDWVSTKTYNKVPVRTLTFKKDSSYTQTISGSLGTFSLISKYYFSADRLVLFGATTKEESRVIFYGYNKFKFSEYSDTSRDLMYSLTFKRKK